MLILYYYEKKTRRKQTFSLHMHAKPSFAHRLQTAKMASSRTSAQNAKVRLGETCFNRA